MTDRLVLMLPPGEDLGVVWHAPLLDYSGYADEARAFVCGLRDRGVKLRARSLGEPSSSFIASLDPGRRGRLDAAMAEPATRHPIHVVHVPGHALSRLPGGLHHVARTMFETDGLPSTWVSKLNQMDEVWVPSSFNVKTFRAAGVHVPLHVVPGGVDVAAFRPGLTPLPISGLRARVFLSVFEWTFRKGWDVLLRAWARAFSASDDVTLLLRTYPMKLPGQTAGPEEIERRINTQLRNVGTSRRRVAPIVVLHDPVAERDMPRLYATADAYVGPARGEGWGRPLLEAMATGLPVLATRWSGNLEFMSDDNSLLVDVESLEPVDHREELGMYQGQRWARPSSAHLTRLLQLVAGDRAAAERVGRRAREDAERLWTWDSAVEAARERIEDIGSRKRSRPSSPAAPAVRWVGDQYAHHSLSHVNREICRRLAASERVDLELASTEDPVLRAVRGGDVAELESCTGEVLGRRADVEVRHQWPPDWNPPASGSWVLIQPWEFGGLPDEWVPHLVDEVDEVWCYTTYVRDCYLASGVPADRLQVIPLGVDTRQFSPDGPRYPLRTGKGTKLLFLGGAIARKGIDVLLRAYVDTFTRDDDVCLVIKSTGGASFYRNSAQDDRIQALAADPAAPEIELISHDLTPEEVASLYRACDALVHPYRGEGFGLPVAEAMASGLPVVVTAHGACLDFCDDDNAFLVPATVSAITDHGLPPSTAGHWWAEPDGAELGRLIRRVVDEPDLARAKGARGRERALAQLRWDRTAARVAERVRDLASVEPRRHRPVVRADPPADPFPLDAEGRVTFFHEPDWQSAADDVVRTYVRAFRPGDPTTLVLRLDPRRGPSLDEAAAHITASIAAAGEDPGQAADILLVADALDQADLERLHAAVDVFVARAGPPRAPGTLLVEDLTPESWQRAMRAAFAFRGRRSPAPAVATTPQPQPTSR